MDEWIDGRMDGWMDEWMGGWVNGWMDEWMNISVGEVVLIKFIGSILNQHQSIKNIPTSIASETMRMIRVPECRNNSSFHKLPTRLTTSPKEPMIILATVVTIITREITARSQQYTTLYHIQGHHDHVKGREVYPVPSHLKQFMW
jgi:hypothetical protein